MKLTKRKAFNFLRSYFDVLNEIEKDEDKLAFLMAIINKQFLDDDPKDLNFIVNLCYQSQRHQIEKSVKGWKRASNEIPPKGDPKGDPPSNPKGSIGLPPKEEKEEEKEKEETITKFLSWFNSTKETHTGKKSNYKTLTKTDKNNLKQLKKVYDLTDFSKAFSGMMLNEWVKETGNSTPAHFLRIDNFNRYLDSAPVQTKKFNPYG